MLVPGWARSVSDNESIESTGLRVLIADEPIPTLGDGLALDIQQGAKIAEELHLVAVVLGVVFDVPLMCAQVFH